MPNSSSELEDRDRSYEEFLKLYSRDRDRLAAYVYSLLPHQADAEDVFQRCSLLLWRKFSEFEPERNFLAWACGVAFYEVRNFLRSASRDRLQFNSELMSQLAEHRLQHLQGRSDLLAALNQCLGRLQTSERELIRVVYEGQQSLKELAETRGQALQTLYNRLSRVRRTLLECVQKRLAAE